MRFFENMLRYSLAFTVCAVVLTTGLETADAKVIDRIVAQVNDEIITMHELEKAATPFMLQNGMDPSALEDPERRDELLGKVLDELVNRELLLQEADKLDLSISDQKVDQWLAYTRKKQNMSEKQFRQLIAKYGMSYDEYREMIRQNLLKIRIVKVKVGSQVTVSDEEVEREYKRRFGGSGDKQKYIDVRHILVRPDSDTAEARANAKNRAQRARKRVLEGESFEKVAGDMGMGPAAEKGGYLGTYKRGDLSEPSFEKAAFDLQPGEVSEVVETKFGFHVIKVDAIEYRKAKGAKEKKARIRAELQQKAVQEQLESYVKTLEARSFVRVKYRPGE